MSCGDLGPLAQTNPGNVADSVTVTIGALADRSGSENILTSTNWPSICTVVATHIIFCAKKYDIKHAVIPVKQQTAYSLRS